MTASLLPEPSQAPAPLAPQGAPALDMGRIKSNIAKMIEMNAPEEDIDDYIAGEGTTVDAVRSWQGGAPQQQQQAQPQLVAGGQLSPSGSIIPVPSDPNAPPTPTPVHPDPYRNYKRAAAEGATMAMMAGGAANVMRAGVTAGTAAAKPITTGVLDALKAGTESGKGLFGLGAAGAAGGVGAQAASDAVPDAYGPGAQQTAGFLGGMGAGAIPSAVGAGVRGVWNAGKKMLYEPFTQAGRERAVTDQMREVSSYKGDPNKPWTNDTAYRLSGERHETPSINEPPPRDELIPGSKRTTAEVAGDPGLAGFERGVAGKNTDEFLKRRNDRAQARVDALGGAEPNSAGGRANLSDNISQEFDQLKNSQDAAVREVAQRAQQEMDALGPGLTPEKAGEIIRAAYDKAYGGIKQEVSTAYKGIDPDNQSGFSLTSLRDQVTSKAKELFGKLGGEPHAEVSSMIDDINKYSKTKPSGLLGPDGQPLPAREQAQPFEEMQKLYSRAIAVGSDSSGTYSARDRAVANKIASEVEKHLDTEVDAGRSGFTPEQVDAYRTARSKRSEQGELYERGAVGKIGKTKAYGEEVVPDSSIASKFFTRGDQGYSDAEGFVTTFKDKPEAMKAAQGWLVGKFQDLRGADGTVSVDDYRRFMKQFENPLRALRQTPEGQALWEKLNTAEKANALAAETADTAKRTVGDYEKGVARFFLGKNPDEAVAAVLNNDNSERLVTQLMQRAGKTPEGQRGIRRAIAEHITEEFQSNTRAGDLDSAGYIKPNAFQEFIASKEQTLRRAGFGDEQIALFKAVAEDVASSKLVSDSAKLPYGSNTAQDTAAQSGLPGKVKRVFHALIGPALGGAAGGATGDLAGGVAGAAVGLGVQQGLERNAAQTNKMLVDAMLNPEQARFLMQKVTPSNEPEILKELSRRMQRLGVLSGVEGADSASDQQKP